MTKTNFAEKLCNVRRSLNLIHCITNPISINLLANAILALGCRPVMAEHPMEAAEISGTASAILLNTGNITDARMQSMRSSAETANAKNIPLVLDIAGASCSTFRRTFISGLLEKYSFTLVKGNYSEILSLAMPGYCSDGVDSAEFTDISAIQRACGKLSEKYGTIILATGKNDIITDGKTCIRVSNGIPMLARVTGTGCLVGAICACFLSVDNSVVSVAGACAFAGICAELSEQGRGTATFALKLLDNISTVTPEQFCKMIKAEVIQYESI